MPLTPVFHLTQDDTTVRVVIRVPHVRVTDAEVILDDRDFSFWCKPYLLKLRLPGALQADEECSAQYFPDDANGTIVATLLKETRGEIFEGLDLTTALMRPSELPADVAAAARSGSIAPTIEVLSSETFDDEPADGATEGAQEPEGAGSSSPTGPRPPAPSASATSAAAAAEDEEALASELCSLSLVAPRYGFNRLYAGVFRDLRDEIGDVLDIADPERTPERERRQLRMQAEDADFDPYRYYGDEHHGAEDPIFMEAMAFQPHWQTDPAAPHEWRAQEEEQMRNLKNREYLIDGRETAENLCCVANILIAYAYDQRTTGGEGTVESAWTIAKLSAALVWLDVFSGGDGAFEALKAGARRCLIYPYMRSWELAGTVVRDVVNIFHRGRRCVLRCLLHVLATFTDHSEGYYLLNKVFVADLATWTQRLGDGAWEDFARVLEAAAPRVTKASMELDLCSIDSWEEEGALRAGEGEDSEEDSEEGSEEEDEEDSEEEDEDGSLVGGEEGAESEFPRAAADEVPAAVNEPPGGTPNPPPPP